MGNHCGIWKNELYGYCVIFHEERNTGQWLTGKTDDNGNAMLQSFLSKLFEKRNRLKILSYRRYGANGNFSLFFFRILFTLLYAVELALSR